MKFTINQQKAIDTDHSNILVSAGAGSGKTAVLTERVIRKMKNKVSIDQLIILTFTNAAADEMKQRIKERLVEIPSLSDELKRLDNAIISTFDAFSLRLVKTYHYLLGLPKEIVIADSIMLENAKEFCLNTTIKKYYQIQSLEFFHSVQRLFDKGDNALIAAVKTLEKGISLHHDPMNFLDSYEETYFSIKNIDENTDEFISYIKILILDAFHCLYDFFDTFENENIEKLIDFLIIVHSLYDELKSCEDFDKIIRFFLEMKHPNQPRWTKDTDPDFIELFKNKNTVLKAKFNQIKEIITALFLTKTDDMKSSVLETKEVILNVVDITRSYLLKLQHYKLKEQLYDFTDIMKYAIQLFKLHPDILAYYKNTMNEIMVDEYQDTNDLQEYLLSLLASNNLFMVGDIKQSIYGFRNANPNNFLKKYHDYKMGLGGIAIDLLENFRSRKEVIDSINHVFFQIMDEKIGGINYQEDQDLHYGNHTYDTSLSINQDYSMELLTYNSVSLQEEGKNLVIIPSYEASIIASDINNKIKEGFLILDSKTGIAHKATYKDFAILVDRKSNFDIYQKVLVESSIPVDKIADEQFSASIEILFIHQFLKLIHCFKNKKYFQEQFKPTFYGVARSFIYEKKDDVIISFLLSLKESDDHQIENLILENNFENIFNDVLYLLPYVNNLPMSELLPLIYDRVSIFKHITKLDNPKNVESKLDFLVMKMTELSTFDFEDVLTYFEQIYVNKELDIEYSLPLSFDKDAVKLMTIHKSKGLEFPVCYYIGLDKLFNYNENKSLFIFDKVYGLFTKSYDNGFKDTIYHILQKRRNYQAYVSERVRLFYVALTRTKEKMILLLNLGKQKEIELTYDDANYLDIEIRRKYRSYSQLMFTVKDIESYMIPALISEVGVPNKMPLDNQKNDIDLIYKKFSIKKEIIEETTFSKKEGQVLSLEEKNAIHLGNILHQELQNFDFYDISNSLNNISPLLKNKIQVLLEMKAFQNLENTKIYQEYEFYDENLTSLKRGVIDLMIVHDDFVDIIDYKLKRIDDTFYTSQLQGYKSYIEKMTNKTTHIYLFSILDGTYKKILEETK